MIHLTNGSAIRHLLDQATATPEQYRRIVVCSPYLDENAGSLLRELALRTSRVQCGLTLITTRLGLNATGATKPFCRTVLVRNLHAKVYLAEGRKPGTTRFLLGSANLTCEGIAGNVEICVAATTTSSEGQRLVSEGGAFLDRLIGRTKTRLPVYMPGRAA